MGAETLWIWNAISSEVGPMRELVNQVNLEYGFNLSDSEIEIVVAEIEIANERLRSLQTIDLPDVPPVTQIHFCDPNDRK